MLRKKMKLISSASFRFCERNKYITCIVHGRNKMKIVIASDHAGYSYKTMLIEYLTNAGQEVIDLGTDSDDVSDYPDYIRPAAEAVAGGEAERGIVLGGSGNGEAIVANRVQGIRCALCWSPESARLARAHNDANMISLGERMISEDVAKAIVDIWLATPFDGGRHAARIAKIDQ
jgi:ribose 5-phosphate isomerase B